MNAWEKKLEFVGEVYERLEGKDEPEGAFGRFDIIAYVLKVPPNFIADETDRAAKMFVEWMYSREEMPQEPMLPGWFNEDKRSG